MKEIIEMFNRNLGNRLTPELCEGLLMRIKNSIEEKQEIPIPDDLLEKIKGEKDVNVSTTD